MDLKMPLLWILLCALVSTTLCSKIRNASVTYDQKSQKFIIHDFIADNSVAYGNFNDEIFQTGWSYLEVKSNELFPDPVQAYAAGLVEGFLTADLLKKHWSNTVADYCKGEEPYCQRLQDFLEQNLDFINKNVEFKRKYDVYWHHVALILEQLQGLDDGFRNITSGPSTKVNVMGLMLLNIMGDVEDLEVVLSKKVQKALGSGSCSALVKVLPDNKDIYFSQDTWSSYNTMLRILKKYSLKFHTSLNEGSPIIPGHTYTFSSQPGLLSSQDDFYLISSGLAAMETTIGNGNASLWQYVTPEGTILEWQRNIIANRLAKNGKQWVTLFSIMNSGTYNNQWMILDYTKFQPGKPLEDGLFWVLEQLPGYLHSEDVTDVLRKQNYWPSYNVAYFKDIFNMSGGQINAEKYGDWFTYERNPRALIFRRDQGKVQDISTMTKLMRYNDYTNDPLSRCNCTPPYSAENAIAARCDLNPENGTYPFAALGHRQHGATDMKLTSSEMFKNLEFVAFGGPTYDPLPPFQWSKSDFDKKVKHEGHPDLWKFKPIVHKWFIIYKLKMTALLVLLTLCIPIISCSIIKNASVTYNQQTKKFTVHDYIVDTSVAYGSFQDEIFQTGWSYLEVNSNAVFSDPVQAYAAGLVEGFLTKDLLKKHWINMGADYCVDEKPYCQRLQKFLQQNLNFINKNIEIKRNYDVYWHQVALVLEQLKGLEDGFKNITTKPSTEVDVMGFMLLNVMGDILDLERILDKKVQRPFGSGSCSALIKVLPNNKDIYFSHDTWTTYSSMLRILKKYSFQFHTSLAAGSPLVPGHTCTFSSQPGLILSQDDFYLISSGLAAMETTIVNSNSSLWQYVTPEGVILEWQRNIIANRLAKNGKQWVTLFGIMNSGTYNNQWMILDYNKFQAGKPLKDGLLWVLEQLPGYLHSEDVTNILRKQNYWPSYNIAYFKDIFNISDAPENVKKFGDFFTYEKAPRALIFKRDHNKVEDITSMINLMRYNDFTHDPLSRCNCSPPYSAVSAIAARCDLNPVNGTYPFPSLGPDHDGATDMKLTTFKLFQNLEFVAFGGPTYDSVPPFQWSKSEFDKKIKHEGHPDLWKFKPIIHKWM
ncbi:putative phospholipase B-like 2 [Trichonephila clavata]|uniref:Putative phospholipase B-like 2 n=1 Tax=Trichonephila clavata TaxID=2740835 RepID=A0A8X6LD54_TRICU|nr:putative phospholipase B-like 2 [Trichonephila clavata]